MNIIIHRGSHEIGGSCVEISTPKTKILLDFGLPLFSPENKKERFDISKLKNTSTKALIEKGILPNIPGLYSKSEPKPAEGILISHAHQDHFGLLNNVRDDMPIYMGIYAKRLIEASNIFTSLKIKINNWKPIETEKSFMIGDIKITPYCMDHSAFDSMSFLIEAENKVGFYTGDFRAHGRKRKLFHRIIHKLPKNMDAMIMEGTVLGNPRKQLKSEVDVEKRIKEEATKYQGLKLIYTSGQNIDRIVSFYKAARDLGKKLVLDIYTAFILGALEYQKIPHLSSSFPEIKVLYSEEYYQKLMEAGYKEFLDKYNDFWIEPREIAKNPGNYFVIYRQGISEEINEIGNFTDSVLIYSLYEGYRHEESYSKIKKFLEKYGIKELIIHTSGHASQEDLKRFAEKLQPKVVIPIHTFAPEKFKEIFNQVKVEILKDGEVFNL